MYGIKTEIILICLRDTRAFESLVSEVRLTFNYSLYNKKGDEKMAYANVRIDGNLVQFRADEFGEPQRPRIVDGRVLVPIRVVLESLGYVTAPWTPTGRVELYNNDINGNHIAIWLDRDTFTLNHHRHISFLDGESGEIVRPQVIGGRIMAPVRALFQALGYGVLWSSQTQTVHILTRSTEYFIASLGEPSEFPLGRMLSAGNALVHSISMFSLNGTNDERIWLFNEVTNGNFVICPKNNPHLCLTAPENIGNVAMLLRLEQFSSANEHNQIWQMNSGESGTTLSTIARNASLLGNRASRDSASLLQLTPVATFFPPNWINHLNENIGRAGRLTLRPTVIATGSGDSLDTVRYNRFILAVEAPEEGRNRLLRQSSNHNAVTGLRYFDAIGNTGSTRVILRHTLTGIETAFNVTVMECASRDAPNVRDHVGFEVVMTGQWRGRRLRCTGCGREIAAPESQDSSRLSSTDNLRVRAALSAISHFAAIGDRNTVALLLREIENIRVNAGEVEYDHSNDGIYARMHQHLYEHLSHIAFELPSAVTATPIHQSLDFLADAVPFIAGLIVPAKYRVAYTAFKILFAESQSDAQKTFLGFVLDEAVGGLGTALDAIRLFSSLASDGRIRAGDEMFTFTPALTVLPSSSSLFVFRNSQLIFIRHD